MTAEVAERTDDEILADLPDPHEDEGYVEASQKLSDLESELLETDNKTEKAKQQLAKIDVVDSESADKAAKLDRRIATLTAKAERLHEAIVFQREEVAAEYKRAQHDCRSQIKQAWEEYYIPEIVEIVDRLAEIRDIYKQLKNRSGGVLNPVFPPPLHGAIGKNAIWTKKRKDSWLKEE